MMRLLLVSVFLLSLFSTSVFAASGGYRKAYISGFYGVTKTTSSTSSLDAINGKTMGGAIGFHLGRHFALELSGRKSSFDEQTSSADLSSFGLGTVSSSTKLDVLFLGAGLRVFFLKILNVSFGLGYSTVNPNFTMSASDPTVAAAIGGAGTEKVSGLGYYYGAGLQIPLGVIEFYGDYIINKFSADVSSTDMIGGLRIRF